MPTPQALWYFGFLSPFAWLQLPRVRALAERSPIAPTPIVLGALLKHQGQLGPAEIPGKREFTYRFTQWKAERAGVTLRFPPLHPFNPLAALRLCIAAGGGWEAVTALFEHIWREGRAASTAEELAPVAHRLGIDDVAAAIADETAKAARRTNTETAIARSVFGVPTLWADGLLFWGEDATGMFEDWLANPARFTQGEYARIASLPGLQRPR